MQYVVFKWADSDPGVSGGLSNRYLKGRCFEPNRGSGHEKARYCDRALVFGSPGWIRTNDQRINSPLRYRCATGEWLEAANITDR